MGQVNLAAVIQKVPQVSQMQHFVWSFTMPYQVLELCLELQSYPMSGLCRHDGTVPSITAHLQLYQRTLGMFVQRF
jgi:hypothetical protein